MQIRKVLAAILGCLIMNSVYSNFNTASAQVSVSGSEVITTGVPILLVGPDSRAAGMGDLGAATSPDANSIHWNPSKIAFIENDWSFGVSYSPWLQKLVNDMWLGYVSGVKRISKTQTVGVSFRYFDMGDLQFTNASGVPLESFNPREAMIDATFAQQLSDKLSIAGTFRFIHSNLAGNITNNTVVSNVKPANTGAVDVSMFYKSKLNFKSFEGDWALGLNISNIGAPVTYNAAAQQDYLPANLRLGTAFNAEFDEFNKLTLAFDVSKLLVPTPDNTITSGQNDPVLSSIFKSFGDAPGGFSEEVKEMIFAVGAEYWYADLIALRGGYFHENEEKGNRRYFTLGLGLRYQVFGFDFAYLIPNQQQHPLADTIRFSLLFNINKGDKLDAPKEGLN
ncbi:hypothetical protein Fleli_1278 [Bernardetia litoralis DSM 6794]|uniref:Type IX secretion system protein PorV domain-containing protein n=1 Tax=Bernardetia litoralis (strain ATCC 23117 / DSM 6794 / NBRC 15988 / NCIMB 1366 / Fx l1 / Sio-4) TaxID=880071 RepID=I4AIC7_BERLS|nr:type IX secretion system outer membrane channel protein PorV [Bernardetia litoralis]AFM03712.1 hypothetical protein Fleli_1278 [Bernardetia litoralis DSM 6794]